MIPDVSEVSQTYEISLQYKKIDVKSKDFEADQIVKEVVDFCGTFTTLKMTLVDRKPENERRWNWKELVTDEDIALDNVILGDDGREYIIHSKEDWVQAGFFRYTCAEQPKGLGTEKPKEDDDCF